MKTIEKLACIEFLATTYEMDEVDLIDLCKLSGISLKKFLKFEKQLEKQKRQVSKELGLI